MIEKMQAEIVAEVNDQSFTQAWQEIKVFARDTKKEIDKNTLFKLQLDKASTKIELDNARALLRQAKKDWDEALVLKYTIKTGELQSKLTEAWRNLNNFKNTGEQSVSRLSALFQKVWIDVWALSTKFWALAIATGFIGIWKQAIQLWDKLEQANISFTTMLWSAEKAKTLLNDLANFAQNTPFELIWLRDTAKQLLAFWIESDQIIPTLKALWDVSAWLSVPIQQVAYAYWQVRVAWRLMWWELMQFTNAWVPMIEYLSKVMWVAQKDVKKMVSEWKVWFSDVQKAFALMTSEWEKFGWLMDAQTESLTWKWSNAVDNMNSKLEKLWTSMLPFAKWVVDVINPILDWVINIWKWLDGGLHLVSMAILQSIYSIQIGWRNVTWNIEILLNWLVWTLRDFWANTSILFENVWIAFWSLPQALKSSLNKWITLIENFLNKAWSGINNFAKKLWFDWDLVGKINLWKLDVDYNQEKFKSFVTTNKDIANARNLAVMDEVQSYKDLKNISKKLNKEKTEDYIQSLFPYKWATEDLNTELKILDDKLTDSEKENAKGKSKVKEDLLKQELEQRKRFAKYQEDLEKKQEEKEKKRTEKLEKASGLIKDYYNVVVDSLEKSQDKIDDFNDKIDETSKKIKDLKAELQNENLEVWTTLEEKRIALIEKRKELEEKFWKSNLETFVWTSDETLAQIWSWTLSWWASWKDILEYKKILEEIAIIEQNNWLITDEAKKRASESESERLIREYNEKKAKIEQEIIDEEARLVEFQRLKDEEKAIYDWINEYRTTLEQNYTTLLQSEAQKRISELEKIRQKAIETANALAKAWITYNTTNENNVNVNLQGTWYTSVDAYNISKTLTENINLSSKWINK